jgi:arylsulfatase A-like enzyme
VPQDEYPLARILTEAGYDTCSVGKWRQMGATPGDWGFGDYITDPTAGGWYWQKSYTKNGQLVETDKEIYYPDVTHDFAVDFLRRHAAGGAAAGKPFFLYYPSHLVHGPIHTPQSQLPETRCFSPRRPPSRSIGQVYHPGRANLLLDYLGGEVDPRSAVVEDDAVTACHDQFGLSQLGIGA